jgi:hypothetical protein
MLILRKVWRMVVTRRPRQGSIKKQQENSLRNRNKVKEQQETTCCPSRMA